MTDNSRHAIVLAHRKEKRDSLSSTESADVEEWLKRNYRGQNFLDPLATRMVTNALSGDTSVPFDLTEGRVSVRQFDQRPVEESWLNAAVDHAKRAPSVCNRQATRVHVFHGEDVEKIRHLQNGNHGFTNLHTVAIFTSVMDLFFPGHEDNQPWFDAGLFSMRFADFLATKGIGTCFLNWCVPVEQDDKLRKLVPIPEGERVICWMAIGYPDETARATHSPRRETTELITHHQPMKSIPVIYWRQRTVILNFGECITPFLVKAFGYKPVHYTPGRPFTAIIGTLLNSHWMEGYNVKNEKMTVWGCGSDGKEFKPEWRDALDIRAVRGPRTRKLLGLPDDFPTGDPGLLVPRFLPIERKPSGKILYAPHFNDRDRVPDDIHERIGSTDLFGIACTLEEFESRVADLVNAEFVLTSSLHVAIICQAYGVPWAFCVPNGMDWNMPGKWRDFFDYLNLGEPVSHPNLASAKEWWNFVGKHARVGDLEPLINSFPHP